MYFFADWIVVSYQAVIAECIRYASGVLSDLLIASVMLHHASSFPLLRTGQLKADCSAPIP